jgi:hypothetical protein
MRELFSIIEPFAVLYCFESSGKRQVASPGYVSRGLFFRGYPNPLWYA